MVSRGVPWYHVGYHGIHILSCVTKIGVGQGKKIKLLERNLSVQTDSTDSSKTNTEAFFSYILSTSVGSLIV